MGGDWLLADPDMKHLRLDMRSVIKYLPPFFPLLS
jgi:hypothetical protein